MFIPDVHFSNIIMCRFCFQCLFIFNVQYSILTSDLSFECALIGLLVLLFGASKHALFRGLLLFHLFSHPPGFMITRPT